MIETLFERGAARGAVLAACLTVAFALGAAGRPALAATPIPAGTNVFGTLSTDLDTKDVNVGDGFTLHLVPPYPNDDQSFAGAYVRGHVANVVRAGQGRKAELDLAFDQIVLPDGATAPVTGHVVRVQEAHHTAVAQQAVGAAAGMIVGNILGKAIGTNVGGLLGATGGFLYANNLKTNFDLPKGSTVVVQVDREVPRPQARH